MFDNIPYISQLLVLATDDLEVSNLLYSENRYRTALYHLQQSTEKTIKAYAMLYFGLKEKESSWDVSHTSPLAIVLPVFRIAENLVILQDSFNDKDKRSFSFSLFRKQFFSNNIFTILMQETKENTKIKKLQKLYKENIRNIIELSKDAISDKLSYIYHHVKSIDKTKLKETVHDIYFPKREPEDKKPTEEKLTQFIAVSIFLDFFLEKHDFKYDLLLFELANITYPYAIITRYPNNLLNNIEINNLGIVKYFNSCAKILGEIIVYLQENIEFLVKTLNISNI